MDITTLVIGLLIGLIFGFAGAWAWLNASGNAKRNAINTTETELKALMAQQAATHLDTTRQSINSIETQVRALKQSISQYEQALQAPEADQPQSAFFGEHASVFLRNTSVKAVKDDFDASGTAHDGSQPRDFANNGSGLFVGNPGLMAEEKSTK